LKTFLYSASHSGDAVVGDQVARLKQEIAQVAASKSGLPRELLEFLASVQKLIAAAEAEKNPIVFV